MNPITVDWTWLIPKSINIESDRLSHDLMTNYNLKKIIHIGNEPCMLLTKLYYPQSIPARIVFLVDELHKSFPLSSTQIVWHSSNGEFFGGMGTLDLMTNLNNQNMIQLSMTFIEKIITKPISNSTPVICPHCYIIQYPCKISPNCISCVKDMHYADLNFRDKDRDGV